MKKLVLVTLLAVAASWLLSEVRFPGPAMVPPSSEVREVSTTRVVAPPAAPPAPRRLIPWRKGDPARPKRVQVAVEDLAGPKNGPTRPKGVAAPSANPMPVWFPKTEADEEVKARPDVSGSRVLVGRLSSSEERARKDLREIVEREVTNWVAADVPPSWKIPNYLIDGMVRGHYVQAVTWSLKPTAGELAPEAASGSSPDLSILDDIQTLYRAGQKVDFSSRSRARIVEAYRRDLASQRMQRLGGGLALALVCLAVLSGYIKADEATKGYYTNRLRLVAAAGLGVAGVVGYRMLG